MDMAKTMRDPELGGAGSPIGQGVFFHADDMGATPSITTRICDAWERGLVDSFSVFGDCDHSDLIALCLSAHPDRRARISVHLNLWEGRPLTPTTRASHLVDRTGHFNTRFLPLLGRCARNGRSREGQVLLGEVEREWRAQIEHVMCLIVGRPLTALDGHIHMHMVPALFRLAVKLAEEYRIPEIRNVHEPFYLSGSIRECFSTRFLANCVKHRVLTTFTAGNAKLSAVSGLTSPDWMIGVLYSGMMSRANISAGVAAATRIGAKRVEILLHIGRADRSELGRWNGNARRASFVLSPARDAEFEELIRLRAPGSLFAPRIGSV
jgi:predicted glycoside hydrolase/deacetylase ChbG (UPF0249 family)